MRVTLKTRAIMWLILVVLAATSVAANPFIREKLMRSATDKTAQIMILSPSGSGPWYAEESDEGKADPDIYAFNGDLPYDGDVIISLLSGKSPEVRGKRDMEKKPLVLKYRWLPGAKEFIVLDEQNKRTEKEKLKLLAKTRGLKESFIKEHYLYQGLLEGTIPAEEVRRHVGQQLWIIADWDQHQDKMDARFTIRPYTMAQFELFKAAEAGDADAQESLRKSLQRPGVPLVSRTEDRPIGREEVRHEVRQESRRESNDEFERRLLEGQGGNNAPDDPASRTEDRREPVPSRECCIRVRGEAGTYLHIKVYGYDDQKRQCEVYDRWVRGEEWFSLTAGTNRLERVGPLVATPGRWYTALILPASACSAWDYATREDAVWSFSSAGRSYPVKMWRAGADGVTIGLRRK